MFGHKDIETTATVVALTDTSSHVEMNGKFHYEVVPPGASDRLDQLRMLRDSGQLTPEEFDALSKQPPSGS